MGAPRHLLTPGHVIGPSAPLADAESGMLCGNTILPDFSSCLCGTTVINPRDNCCTTDPGIGYYCGAFQVCSGDGGECQFPE